MSAENSNIGFAAFVDKKAKEAEASGADRIKEVLDKTDRLIGADSFKAVMHDLATIAPAAKERGLLDALFYRNYVFSVDGGCGFSTCIGYMTELLEAAGVSPMYSSEGKITRSKIVYPNKYKEKVHRVECIDISELVGETDRHEFKNILRRLSLSADNTVYVFRVPSLEDDLLEKLCDSISDILYVECVKFEPLSFSDMREFASREALKMGFTFADGFERAFDLAMVEEKTDGKFYGYNTVKKVVQEIVFKKLVSGASKTGDAAVIDEADIDIILKKKNVQTAEEMLKALCGMDRVKSQIKEIVDQISYMHDKKVGDMPCIHMRFVGNPGTGKTTVARIVGRMLTERGVLKNGGFHEYTGRGLVAKFVGHTEEKVKEICVNAYGSVLFIDEAYSLYAGADNDNDYGLQALSVLMTEMENHRSDMVVIMAGYSDEMDTLMTVNKGLESRMPYEIVFDNYNRDELKSIFMQMATEFFDTDPELEKTVDGFFAALPEDFIGDKSFGNGRYVRNLFERTQKKAINRCMREQAEKVLITCGDFISASKEAGFAPEGMWEDGAHRLNTIGF